MGSLLYIPLKSITKKDWHLHIVLRALGDGSMKQKQKIWNEVPLLEPARFWIFFGKGKQRAAKSMTGTLMQSFKLCYNACFNCFVGPLDGLFVSPSCTQKWEQQVRLGCGVVIAIFPIISPQIISWQLCCVVNFMNLQHTSSLLEFWFAVYLPVCWHDYIFFPCIRC